MPTIVDIIRQTGFRVGETDVRFGLLWPDAMDGLPDWSIPSEPVILRGPGLYITQDLEMEAPPQISYRVVCESIDDAKTLKGLLRQTGILTLYHETHTVDPTETEAIDEHDYDRIDSVTLVSLTNVELFLDGSWEADALFEKDDA